MYVLLLLVATSLLVGNTGGANAAARKARRTSTAAAAEEAEATAWPSRMVNGSNSSYEAPPFLLSNGINWMSRR